MTITEFQEFYDPIALGVVAFLVILLVATFGVVIREYFKNRGRR